MELSVSDLAVSLGNRQVLRGVAAAFRPGRVTAILGPNGSGKSTLVRTLAGLLDADAGHVRIDGRHIARIEPRERARLIGYLPQDATVHWNVRVRDLVALGRLPHRSPFAGESEADAMAIGAALAATDTFPLAARATDALSGGERARVLLARVLAGEPRWLLADEPLASLDPVHQLALLDQLRALAASGMGVVIVLHDLIQAARAADDVLLLKAGEVVAFGPAAEALTHQPLREAFGVEVMIVPDEQGRLLPVPIGRTKA
ncbi:iron complex transport system ATP-binding protein [Sphingomonas naasensis]|uniref:ABC transporter ATP-binding protein n=1 Tax=Sphingomonas naasensis TaxID=1344951 RepID=A0A4S1W8M4_9SPHN|nr:ABC transporter ATP-binding protein [Sphingomonas naasensis]NIJ19506.1 iron complex transport system ATP-binding protein [Sphingomonas naasensis]TGX39241.1 ABC transporter ATP-binding protein [Sphingomonas naasensis]